MSSFCFKMYQYNPPLQQQGQKYIPPLSKCNERISRTVYSREASIPSQYAREGSKNSLETMDKKQISFQKKKGKTELFPKLLTMYETRQLTIASRTEFRRVQNKSITEKYSGKPYAEVCTFEKPNGVTVFRERN